MISSIQFSEKSLNLLNLRKLSQDEIQQFSELLTEAKSQQASPKNTLLAMSADELKLIQKANSLAAPINVSSLSEEGARNLLSQPDNSDKVDLNNDGIVEVGAAKSIIFPPVNAPKNVKLAWESATAGMEEGDKLSLQLSMHIAIYGINIEGVSQKQALDPAKQWSQQGIEQLFKDLHSNLDFRVNMEGWTEHNVMLKGFYERFESALDNSGGFSVASAGRPPTQTNNEQDTYGEDGTNKIHSKLMQLLLDGRMGIDREKLEEIEDKIKAVEGNSNLSGRQKQDLIKALEQQKAVVIEQAQKRSMENEKRKSLLSNNINMFEKLEEQKLKQLLI